MHIVKEKPLAFDFRRTEHRKWCWICLAI